VQANLVSTERVPTLTMVWTTLAHATAVSTGKRCQTGWLTIVCKSRFLNTKFFLISALYMIKNLSSIACN
jgi:hypothetical protein